MAYRRVEFYTGSGKRVSFRARVSPKAVRVKKHVKTPARAKSHARRKSTSGPLVASW